VARNLIIQFFHPEGMFPSGGVLSFSGVFKMGMDVFGNTPRSDKGTYFVSGPLSASFRRDE
jgi:hypothetical protein